MSSGPDALHHGRHGPEGQLRSEILVPQLQFLHVVDFPVVVQRLIPTVQTLCRTRGIAQLLYTVIDVPVAFRAGHSCNDAEAILARCVQRQVPWLRSAVAAHLQGRPHPCRGAEFHRDSPVAVYMVVDVPVAQVVQDIPVGTQRLVSMVSLTIEIPQFVDKVIDFPVVLVVRVHRCRRGEDSRAPTVALVEKLDALRPL